MELQLKDYVFLITQVVIVTAIIVSNRQNIIFLKQQNNDLKIWIKELQAKVNDIRVKVGI
jgi:hypothetical protein